LNTNQTKAPFTTCRICGGPVPESSIQGQGWHRECAFCYHQARLPDNWAESREIAITLDDKWYRIFPHISNDGLLALREVMCCDSYVLLVNGDIRMRPDNFKMPIGTPASLAEDIEKSFIVERDKAILVRRIFRAYAEKNFEVIDSGNDCSPQLGPSDRGF
jgi:hypothetical protein